MIYRQYKVAFHMEGSDVPVRVRVRDLTVKGGNDVENLSWKFHAESYPRLLHVDSRRVQAVVIEGTALEFAPWRAVMLLLAKVLG